MPKKKVLEGKLDYQNEARDLYFEWITLDENNLVETLKSFFGKKVRITIETIK